MNKRSIDTHTKVSSCFSGFRSVNEYFCGSTVQIELARSQYFFCHLAREDEEKSSVRSVRIKISCTYIFNVRSLLLKS